MRLKILLFLCISFFPSVLWAQNYSGERVPPLTRKEGAVNLTHEWIVHHGARMYWKSTQFPQQVRLAGMRFEDPADVPCLDMNNLCYDKKKTKYRYKKRAVRRKYTAAKKKPIANVKKTAFLPMKTKSKRALGPAKPRKKRVPQSGGLPTVPATDILQ